MRIAIICTEKLPVPAIRGGAIQLYIEELLPYFSQKYEVTVFSLADSALPMSEERGRVRHIRIPAKNEATYLLGLKKSLRGQDFDLVHVCNRPAWISGLRQVTPARLVLSLHNDMFRVGKINAKMANEALEQVSKVVTVSKFIADKTLELYPQALGKIGPIYSGVNPERIRTKENRPQKAREMRRRLGIGSNCPVVLSVGRLSPKKGSHVILRAMDHVWKKVPEAVLLMVGSKWYGSNNEDDYVRSLKEEAESGKGRTIFTGFIPPKEMGLFFLCGDVFVCASQWEEPLARVHYEAMAAGLPIITTNRGGNPEVVNGKGCGLILNDYDNPVALSGLLNYILNNPDTARKMGRKGRQLAHEEYHWERVANELILEYEKAVGK